MTLRKPALCLNPRGGYWFRGLSFSGSPPAPCTHGQQPLPELSTGSCAGAHGSTATQASGPGSTHTDRPRARLRVKPPPVTSASGAPIFFEAHAAARCGLHALNNAIGGSFFNAEEMSLACTAYIEEARREGLWESRDDHERAGGWYSEAVLAYVVRWKIAQNTLGAYTHMKLDLDNPVQPAEASARRVFDADTWRNC